MGLQSLKFGLFNYVEHDSCRTVIDSASFAMLRAVCAIIDPTLVRVEQVEHRYKGS